MGAVDGNDEVELMEQLPWSLRPRDPDKPVIDYSEYDFPGSSIHIKYQYSFSLLKHIKNCPMCGLQLSEYSKVIHGISFKGEPNYDGGVVCLRCRCLSRWPGSVEETKPKLKGIKRRN